MSKICCEVASQRLDRSRAPIAQLVEHLICNQGVGGSNPSGGTMKSTRFGIIGPSVLVEAFNERVTSHPFEHPLAWKKIWPPLAVTAMRP